MKRIETTCYYPDCENLPPKNRSERGGWIDGSCYCNEHARESVSCSELDRLRADAERLDWLEKAKLLRIDMNRDIGGSEFNVTAAIEGSHGSGMTLREAIDAARKREEERG